MSSPVPRLRGGEVPEISRFLGIVVHMYELLDDWVLATARQPLRPIAPLE